MLQEPPKEVPMFDVTRVPGFDKSKLLQEVAALPRVPGVYEIAVAPCPAFTDDSCQYTDAAEMRSANRTSFVTRIVLQVLVEGTQHPGTVVAAELAKEGAAIRYRVHAHPMGYDSAFKGMLYTDRAFEAAVRKAVQAKYPLLDVCWSEQGMQGCEYADFDAHPSMVVTWATRAAKVLKLVEECSAPIYALAGVASILRGDCDGDMAVHGRRRMQHALGRLDKTKLDARPGMQVASGEVIPPEDLAHALLSGEVEGAFLDLVRATHEVICHQGTLHMEALLARVEVGANRVLAAWNDDHDHAARTPMCLDREMARLVHDAWERDQRFGAFVLTPPVQPTMGRRAPWRRATPEEQWGAWAHAQQGIAGGRVPEGAAVAFMCEEDLVGAEFDDVDVPPAEVVRCGP